ncbi:MAG: hypothetical protein L3J08_04655 [Flavobacteriaceae bacterium]|nr:hypothetical protein [Flavobacteriaceae bacterium]
MTNCEVSIRSDFFISALFVENMITTYLSESLKINDIVNSKFLGNNKGALTFDQKIEFLLESDKFSVIDNSKLSVFREIYKEFSNNKNAESIEYCFTSSDCNDDFLLILYPQNESISREEKLTNACYQLIDETSQLISNFTKKPEIKLRRRSIFTSILSKVTPILTLLFIK